MKINDSNKKIVSLAVLAGVYATLAINGIAKAPTNIADIGETEQPPALIEPMSNQQILTKETIKLALASISDKYGLNYRELYNVIECESGFVADKEGDDGFSIGVAQFTLDTWLENCSDGDERKNAFKSLECMGKMFSRGMQNRWTCWRNLYQNN